MSHAIDFQALDEKLFVLQQIVLGSERYCEQRKTGGESDAGDGELDAYWGWMKTIVCNYLLECAVKTRVFQDYLLGSRFDHDFAKIDEESRQAVQLGIVRKGTVELTLRETCNKIIHATRVVVIWAEKEYSGEVIKYWNGILELHGSKGRDEWQVDLHVGEWARAMVTYHELLSRPRSARMRAKTGKHESPHFEFEVA